MARRLRIKSSRSHARGVLTATHGDARLRALDALSRVRGGASLSKAARDSDTTVSTMQRYVGSALYKEQGRWKARRRDQLKRRMRWVVETDVVTIDVADSRTGSRISRYWTTVKRYLETGDESGLRRFQGKSIRVNGRTYAFVTDPDVLDELGRRGQISFETIYSEAA